jgi:hypothetical protein
VTEVHALAVLAATGSTVTPARRGSPRRVTDEYCAYVALTGDLDAVIGLEAEQRELVRRGSYRRLEADQAAFDDVAGHGSAQAGT